jgi:hypothetical protein
MQNIAVGILENRNDDVAARMRDVPLAVYFRRGGNAWVVDRFAACVRDKFDPAKKNRTPFSDSPDRKCHQGTKNGLRKTGTNR